MACGARGRKKVSFIPRPRKRSRGFIDGGKGLGDYENIFPKSLETTEPGFWAELWWVCEFRELFLSAFFSSRRSGSTMWPVVLLLGWCTFFETSSQCVRASSALSLESDRSLVVAECFSLRLFAGILFFVSCFFFICCCRMKNHICDACGTGCCAVCLRRLVGLWFSFHRKKGNARAFRCGIVLAKLAKRDDVLSNG